MRHGGVVGFDVAHLGQYVEFPQKLLVHWTHRENSKSRKMKMINEIGWWYGAFLFRILPEATRAQSILCR